MSPLPFAGSGRNTETQMTYRRIVTLISLASLAGCGAYYREPRPQIISAAPVEPIVPRPPQAELPGLARPVPADVPADWVPPKDIEKKWTAIVIHHSGTANGNVEIFDRWHREKQWDGVGYDFVIGNGSDSGDGQVEVTYRWRQQKVGAHCKTPDNWANIEGIGICLVGNFNVAPPTERQREALARLVRFLEYWCDVPATRIYGHHATPGANETECPGSLFSMDMLTATPVASANPSPSGQ
jgi:hypothetical protein